MIKGVEDFKTKEAQTNLHYWQKHGAHCLYAAHPATSPAAPIACSLRFLGVRLDDDDDRGNSITAKPDHVPPPLVVCHLTWLQQPQVGFHAVSKPWATSWLDCLHMANPTDSLCPSPPMILLSKHSQCDLLSTSLPPTGQHPCRMSVWN